jgi:hypothetical protein
MGMIEMITWAAEDGISSIENRTSSRAAINSLYAKNFQSSILDPKDGEGLREAE